MYIGKNVKQSPPHGYGLLILNNCEQLFFPVIAHTVVQDWDLLPCLHV